MAMWIFVFGILTCSSLVPATAQLSAPAAPKVGRIVLSHKTGREGPGSYMHVREDLPISEQVKGFAEWWNMTSEESQALEIDVSKAILAALSKQSPHYGAETSAAKRFSASHLREMLEDRRIQTVAEPMRLHKLSPAFFEQVKQETLRMIEKNAAVDVSSKTHPIQWVLSYGRTASYSLIAASGNVSDTSDLLTFDTQKKHFSQAEQYPALDTLMKLFPHTTNWRINVLHESDAGSASAVRYQASGFSPHRAYILHEVRDTVTGDDKTVLRMKFHLPIVTNDYVDMHQYDRSYVFHPGDVYFFTNGIPHSVENRGNGPRIHLIWDMLLSEDTWNRSFGEGPDLHPSVQRIIGAERQCDIKGAWHWSGFEQEPEKTWREMSTYFDNLIDVSTDDPSFLVSRWGAKTVEVI